MAEAFSVAVTRLAVNSPPYFFPWHRPCVRRKKGGNTMVTLGDLFSILTFLVVFADFVLKHTKKHKKSKRK